MKVELGRPLQPLFVIFLTRITLSTFQQMGHRKTTVTEPILPVHAAIKMKEEEEGSKLEVLNCDPCFEVLLL